MNIVKNYLKILNEAKSYKDGSMPNPYDYQSLELDEKVTRADLKELDKFRKKMKKFEDPKTVNLSAKEWLYYEPPNFPGGELGRKHEYHRTFTVVDNRKRVGIVSTTGSAYILWSSWVPGFNYAVRGTMKMLEQLTEIKDWRYRQDSAVYTIIWHKNIPSIKVAKKLKMKLTGGTKKEEVAPSYMLDYPFWWIKK